MAAAAAPPHQTGVATGLTNTTKTLGGAFASAIFALALASGIKPDSTTAASLSGYQTVWAICGGTAIIAVISLMTVPRVAFTHADPSAEGLVLDSVGRRRRGPAQLASPPPWSKMGCYEASQERAA